MNPSNPESLEFNTALYVSHDGPVLDVPGLRDSIDSIAPHIAGW